MANTNKVEFGMSGAYYGKLTQSAGTYSIAAPVALPGIVSLTVDATENETKFYADNLPYYVLKNNAGSTGELVMSKFPDAFKTTILGYKALASGAIAELDNAQPVAFCLGFIGEGDVHQVKRLIYNCIPGKIRRSFKTNAEGVEVEVETLPITVIGIPVADKDGVVWTVSKASFLAADTGYATAITTMTVPSFPIA